MGNNVYGDGGYIFLLSQRLVEAMMNEGNWGSIAFDVWRCQCGLTITPALETIWHCPRCGYIVHFGSLVYRGRHGWKPLMYKVNVGLHLRLLWMKGFTLTHLN